MSCEFPYRVNLDDAISGRTWNGGRFIYSGDLPYTLARATCTITDSAGTDTVFDSSDDSGITIIDSSANAWQYQIDPILRVGFAAGNYSYKIDVYLDVDSDGVEIDADDYLQTHFYGTWKIT